MTVNTTKPKDIKLWWKDSSELTVREYQRMTSGFEGKSPYSYDFWYKYSKFGAYIIGELSQHRPVSKEVNKDNWNDFLPYLKNYFLTHEEVGQILRNIWFMGNGRQHKVKEDPVFMLLQVFKELGGRSLFSELMNMEYKTFFKIYLYTIGNNALGSRELRGLGENLYG